MSGHCHCLLIHSDMPLMPHLIRSSSRFVSSISMMVSCYCPTTTSIIVVFRTGVILPTCTFLDCSPYPTMHWCLNLFPYHFGHILQFVLSFVVSCHAASWRLRLQAQLGWFGCLYCLLHAWVNVQITSIFLKEVEDKVTNKAAWHSRLKFFQWAQSTRMMSTVPSLNVTALYLCLC